MKATEADLEAARAIGRESQVTYPMPPEVLARVARIVSDGATTAPLPPGGAVIGSAESSGARSFGRGRPHPPASPASGGSARPSTAA